MSGPKSAEKSGTLYGVGLGPGDPELVTLKALRILASAPVVAHFRKKGRPGHARTIAAPHLADGAVEAAFEYPVTTEIDFRDDAYVDAIRDFYTASANAISAHLDAGRDVALLCEGDPFFYGSSMYLFDRLRDRFATEIVPGVLGMTGCWAEARLPMTHGDDVLAVLPGTMAAEALASHLAGADAAVIMKLGRNLPKVRAALEAAGRADRAVYVERGTMAGSRIRPLPEKTDDAAPYFSLILVPGRQRTR